MNERIRELYSQAGVINNNFNPLAYEQWYLDALEKFAELIVGECADVGSKFSMAHPEDIRYQIKRHFGVEE